MFEDAITRTFIQTSEFTKAWEKLGLNDDDLRTLEAMIMQNPDIGAVIQGTDGLRKMRFAYKGQGKSGSVRVCYVDFIYYETVYLVTAYAKSDKDNLSKAERNGVKKIVEFLKEEVRRSAGGDQNE